MKIKIKATAALTINDHVTRGLDTTYGALIGLDHDGEVVATQAFELKMTGSQIDIDHLRQRIVLLSQVSPATEFQGLYCVAGPVPQEMVAQAAQHDYVAKFVLEKCNSAIQCKDPYSGARLDFQLAPGPTERIAADTARNHYIYTQGANEVRGPSEVAMAKSLAQLEIRVKQLVSLSPTTAEFDRKLVYLANKVRHFKHPAAVDLDWIIPHLSLLENEISLVHALIAQEARRIPTMLHIDSHPSLE